MYLSFQIHCTMWSFLVYWSHMSKPCFRWQCQTWWHFSLRQSQDSLPLPATSCFLFSIIVNHHGHDHKLIIKIETHDNKIRSGFPPPWLQEGSGWISRSYRLRKKTNDWSLAIYFIMMTTMMILKIMMTNFMTQAVPCALMIDLAASVGKLPGYLFKIFIFCPLFLHNRSQGMQCLLFKISSSSVSNSQSLSGKMRSLAFHSYFWTVRQDSMFYINMNIEGQSTKCSPHSMFQENCHETSFLSTS